MKRPRKQRRRIYQQRRYAASYIYVDAIKLARGCADCGYRAHARALDFDHLPNFVKVKNVAQLISGKRANLDAEIAKCEVVCANCHRIRTAERRKGRI